MDKAISPNAAIILVAAAALVREDGAILMQRRPQRSQHGGLWEFPGGKCEPGEALHNCLARELQEELGIAIETGNLVSAGWARVAHQSGELILMLMICRRWAGVPQAEPGAELRWVSIDHMHELAMPPADIPLARGLAHYL